MRPAKGRHASFQPSARALGLKMLGSYEQVPPFRFRRKKIFDVVESGIVYRGRLYRWNEITDFQRSRGVGFIECSDGTRCRIQMNSFRRVGERRRLSWSGDNPTFRELASYWFEKRVDSRMSPKMEPIKSRISELEKALDSASDPDEVDRLGRKFMRLNREYVQLQLAYPDEIRAEFERVRQKRRKEHSLVILIVVILLVFSGLATWID